MKEYIINYQNIEVNSKRWFDLKPLNKINRKGIFGVMNDITKEYIIECLVKLLIKTDIEDRKKGTDTYVKKTRIYKDLIQFLKEYDFR